jgi:hypothetical protein
MQKFMKRVCVALCVVAYILGLANVIHGNTPLGVTAVCAAAIMLVCAGLWSTSA